LFLRLANVFQREIVKMHFNFLLQHTGRVIGTLMFVFTTFLVAAAQSSGGVSITITKAPPEGDGASEMEKIVARVRDPELVCGANFVECNVALFTFIEGSFFPQPFLNHQLSLIDRQGVVEESVHLGSLYEALVVRKDNYQPQAASISSLPLKFALAHDEARPGTLIQDDESAPASAPQNSDQSEPDAQTLTPVQTTAPVRTVERDEPAPVWSTPFLIGMLSLIVLVLALAVSGRIADFGEAFEHFLTQLFRSPAVYFKTLHDDLRAFAADPVNAARFFGAILCLVVAVGVAIGNYFVIRFSFELLLPAGEALTAVAISYVFLKAVAGVMVHFLGKGLARRIVIFALLLSSFCSMVLAYQRAVALSEVNNALQSSEQTKAVITIDDNFALPTSSTVDPIEPVAAAPSNPSGPLGMFSLEAALVAVIALVIDLFELLCVFGALSLSTAGVVSFVCLPFRVLLAVVKNTFLLVDQTSLARLISIVVKALLETPRIIVPAVLKVLKKLSLFLLEELKAIAVAIYHHGLAAIARWRKRRIYKLRAAAVLERVKSIESNKLAAIQFRNDCADDQRASERKRLQLQARFAEQELIADLEHKAALNRAIRVKTASVLEQNLERVESLPGIARFTESPAKRKNGNAPPPTTHAEASARANAGNLN
jgi:hypothetical protein